MILTQFCSSLDSITFFFPSKKSFWHLFFYLIYNRRVHDFIFVTLFTCNQIKYQAENLLSL